jgi:hypothetical protein
VEDKDREFVISDVRYTGNGGVKLENAASLSDYIVDKISRRE